MLFQCEFHFMLLQLMPQLSVVISHPNSSVNLAAKRRTPCCDYTSDKFKFSSLFSKLNYLIFYFLEFKFLISKYIFCLMFNSWFRFIRDNQEKVDTLQKCNITSLAASMWLNIRLQLIGICVIASVCFIAILQRHFDVAHSGKRNTQHVGNDIFLYTVDASLFSNLDGEIENKKNQPWLKLIIKRNFNSLQHSI